MGDRLAMRPAIQATQPPILSGMGNEYRPVWHTGRYSSFWMQVCVTGRTVISLTCAIPERFSDNIPVDNCLSIYTIAGKRHLRSAGTGSLSVSRTRTTLGTRSFAVTGPVIWNSLPTALRSATLSPSTFARHLKADLSGWLIAHLGTIYEALYKSPHHHHHVRLVIKCYRNVLFTLFDTFNETRQHTGVGGGKTGSVRSLVLQSYNLHADVLDLPLGITQHCLSLLQHLLVPCRAAVVSLNHVLRTLLHLFSQVDQSDS